MSGSVEIRAAREADAATIAAIYRPYVEASAVSFEEVAPTRDEIGARMAASPRLPWLVATRADVVVGYAYASRHRDRPAYRWAVDCSVYLAASEQRRGAGSALYTQLFPLLRDLGYYRVYAGIALPNDASVALHEALGFTPVGVYRRVGYKLHAWHDVGWWQLSLRDDEEPVEPVQPRGWDG